MYQRVSICQIIKSFSIFLFEFPPQEKKFDPHHYKPEAPTGFDWVLPSGHWSDKTLVGCRALLGNWSPKRYDVVFSFGNNWSFDHRRTSCVVVFLYL